MSSNTRLTRLSLLVLAVFLAAASPAVAFDQDHKGWDVLLKERVEETGYGSRVDYRSLKKDPSALNRYTGELEAVSDADFQRFSRDEKLAFLINAYNAFTLKLIVDNYPVQSIKDLGSLFRSPWKRKFFRLLGAERNLDEIEHEMIRPVFGEPRVHFALVCASKSCPQLRKEAYVATRLNAQFEDGARKFLADPNLNRFDKEKRSLLLSPIFKWYKEDFEKKDGSVIDFIAPRLSKAPGDETLIRSGSVKLSYSEYDWTLNDSRVF